MPQTTDAKKLIKSNSKIDLQQMDEIREAWQRMRKLGLRRAKYNLASPLDRREVRVEDDATHARAGNQFVAADKMV